MRKTMVAVLGISALLLSSTAFAGERRPRVEQDECSKRSAVCERACDSKSGPDRLSCKTDCRLAESQCRNAKR